MAPAGSASRHTFATVDFERLWQRDHTSRMLGSEVWGVRLSLPELVSEIISKSLSTRDEAGTRGMRQQVLSHRDEGGLRGKGTPLGSTPGADALRRGT